MPEPSPATPAPELTTSSTWRADRRGRAQLRVLWARDRARNALRHPARLLSVAGVLFVVILGALILLPYQARRAGAALMPRADEWRDTVALRERLVVARREVAAAGAAFAAARAAATAPPPEPLVVVRELTPEEQARRDSLRRVGEELRPLVARAERAPLPASYRALGQARALAGDARVRVLLDSLAVVEAEREAFGALGGVDPVYVSLTNRANALGRALLEAAQARIAEAEQAMAAITPTVMRTEPPPREPVDTLGPQQRVVDARNAMRSVLAELEAARAHNARLAERAAEARRRADIGAPPLAILLAALVLGLALGYAWELGGEALRPRVAGVAEAERVTGARVLSVVRPHAPLPEYGRRQADLVVPRLLDPRADAYRLLHLSVAPAGATLPAVIVTGEEARVVATVAVNLAARATMEARSTAVVDLDRRAALVAGVLGIRRSPGVGEILAGEAEWAECTVGAMIGRDLVLDVVPGGVARGDHRPPDTVRAELARLVARHDLVVFAAPLDYLTRGRETVLPTTETILCARVGDTRVSALGEAVDALRAAGLQVHGLVLWDLDGPHVEPPPAGASRRRVTAGASS